MSIKWDDGKRSQLGGMLAAAGAESLNLLSLARGMAEGRQDANLRFLLSCYVQGACSFHDHFQHELREVIDRVGICTGALMPGESLFDDGRSIRESILARVCPELMPAIYRPRPNAELEAIPLLEPCPNELAANSPPPPMNMLLHRSRRPAVQAYATDDALVYAH